MSCMRAAMRSSWSVVKRGMTMFRNSVTGSSSSTQSAGFHCDKSWSCKAEVAQHQRPTKFL